MSQEQPKLTLAEVKEIAEAGDNYPHGWFWPVLARALLAYDKALCQARSDLIVAGMFDSAKEVEAALLPKGETDE